MNGDINMKTCKVLMPSGGVGSGIHKEAFERGLNMAPDVIAVDGGSTDSGPYYLGTGEGKYAREALKNDLRIMVNGAHKLGIPVMVGSCGTCGSDYGVNLCADIVEEIFKKDGFRMKIAKIFTQQDPKTLKEKWKQGKIHPLEGAPEITEKTFDECSTIVAVAGIEPFVKALREGAQIVLCGRATDTADIAALPIMMGCNEAAAWHAGKTIECGGVCLTSQHFSSVMAEIDEEGFKVYPTIADPDVKATPYTISAHMLYENANPYQLTEPSGTFDTSQAVYTQIDDRSVYVKGTTFTHAKQYTMKLEGSGPVGYQTVSIVGIADKGVCVDPETWMNNLTQDAVSKLNKYGFSPEDYSFDLKPYGYNAVTGAKPKKGMPPPREIGLMLIVTANTQELANQISKVWNPLLLHFPVYEGGLMPSFAFPFSPAHIEKGKIFEFKLYHVVDLDDPLELCRIEYVD